MTPCSDAVGYLCFTGPCCLYLQGKENGNGERAQIWEYVRVCVCQQEVGKDSDIGGKAEVK